MQRAIGFTKKFKIATLGCRTNQYESQAFSDQLRAMGYQEAQENESAEMCIVNTCTVTKSADSHSRRQIRQLAHQHPGSRMIVTGCLAQRDPQQLKALGVDVKIISNKDKHALIQLVLPDEDAPEFSIRNFEARTRAFVKVQDGCNSFCSYCIIPHVRGRSRSRPTDDIVKEIEGLIANGYREVVLTGINIGDFADQTAQTESLDLADLVHRVDQIEGLERLRISSIDPDEVDSKLLNAVIKGRKTCSSMHIVLQSGSNIILKRMNRKYTRQIFFDTCMLLRAERADFTFTTDIIVGFPGETDADFQETIDVVKQIGFAKVHVFPFSARPGTRAHKFPDQLSPELIKERTGVLLHICEQAAFAMRDSYIGQTLWVLTEDRSRFDARYISGHTDNFIPVLIDNIDLPANSLARVKIEKNSPLGLIGALQGQYTHHPIRHAAR